MLVHRVLLAVDEGDAVAADEALAVLATVPDQGTVPRLTALRKAAALHRARLAADLAVAHASDLVEDVGPSHLPADLDPDVRLLVLADRGALRLFEGDHSGARRDLLQAIELARVAGLHSVQLYCKNLVAGTYVAESDFMQARVAAEKAIAFATARGWDRAPSLAYSYVLAGWTSFQVLRPEEASTWAAISIDVIDTTSRSRSRARPAPAKPSSPSTSRRSGGRRSSGSNARRPGSPSVVRHRRLPRWPHPTSCGCA